MYEKIISHSFFCVQQYPNQRKSSFVLLCVWCFCISQGVLFQENDHEDGLHSWLLLYFLSCCIFYYSWQQIKTSRSVFSLASRVLNTPYHFIKSIVVISQLFLAVLPDAFEFSQTTQGTISANSQPLSTLLFKMEVFDTCFSAGDLLVNKASWKCRHFPFVLGVTILHPVWCCVNALLKCGEGKAQAQVDFSWQQTLQMFVFHLSPGFERDLDAAQGRYQGDSSWCQRSFHSHQ